MAHERHVPAARTLDRRDAHRGLTLSRHGCTCSGVGEMILKTIALGWWRSAGGRFASGVAGAVAILMLEAMSPAAAASEVWTAERAVAVALERNPDLMAARQ